MEVVENDRYPLIMRGWLTLLGSNRRLFPLSTTYLQTLQHYDLCIYHQPLTRTIPYALLSYVVRSFSCRHLHFFVFAVFTFFLHFWSFVKYIVSSLFITCPFSDFIPSFAPSYYILFFALLLPLLSLSFPSRSLVDPSSTSGDFICSEHPITTKFRNILLCMLAPPQSRSAICIC